MHLDIRTKLVVLFIASMGVFFTNSFYFEILIMSAIGTLQLLSGKKIFSAKLVSVYLLFVIVQKYILPILPAMLEMILSFPVVRFRILFPTAMAGILIIKTTQVNEFISTMTKMKIPKPITTSLAVTFRYFPAIIEEWGYIKDAMRIRKISTTHINPVKSVIQKIECYYVPLLISASKTAEELTAAAVTRGIDNPKPGSCRGYQRFAIQDYGIMLIFIFLIVVGEFLIRKR